MSHSEHPTPLRRLLRLIKLERRDLIVLGVFTVGMVLMSLTVPLATQALVNTIAGGLFLQPIVVLSTLVFGGLFIAGLIQLLQLTLVESIQQRIFAETAIDVSEKLVRSSHVAFRGEYAPELVNRFFDVLTIQKSLSKLLIDGFNAACQAILGLTILWFYGESLFLVDLLIVIGFLTSTVVLGFGGLRSSIAESKAKYSVVDWLEDVARCHTSLKLHGNSDFIKMKADSLVVKYVNSRRTHFQITRRQSAGYYLFFAIASAAILAAGGWLVLDGQLTLGQLIATQIIVTTVFAAMEKLVRQTEMFFDLLTGLDKVGHVTDLPQERDGGVQLPTKPQNSGASVDIRSVKFAYTDDSPVLDGLSLHLKPGDRVSLVGASGAGKSTLAALMCGLEIPSHGTVDIDGVEIRDVDLDCLRAQIGLAGYDLELFDGTIEENIAVGRSTVTHDDIRWAMELVHLVDDLAFMNEGFKSKIISGGKNLSRGQIQRVLLARAIVGHPSLLILDEAFTGIDERITVKILDAIFAPENGWTILDISHQAEVVTRTETVHVLADGKIKETGSPAELAANPNSEFSILFPYLSASLRPKAVASTPRRVKPKGAI